MKRRQRRLLCSAILVCLTGTWLGVGRAAADPLADLLLQAASPPRWLLGEVHDNAQQHALRQRAFEALLKAGARPALLMEQFDRERQADIDQARAQPGASADSIVAAAATSNAQWAWPFYKPFIALALSHGLPIVAANVSRAEARRVMSEGLKPLGFDDRVPADISAAQSQTIVDSHCGALNATQGLRMAAAQVARDQFMAQLVERHASRGFVLLAGNGHVRRDIGVPRWLSPDLARRTRSIGLLEEGDTEQSAYDQVIVTPRQSREDPCAAMRPGPERKAS